MDSVCSSTYSNVSVLVTDLLLALTNHLHVYLPFQGCVDIKLNNTELGTLSEKTSEIQAFVDVVEPITGEKHNATWKGQVVYLPFKIDFVSRLVS